MNESRSRTPKEEGASKLSEDVKKKIASLMADFKSFMRSAEAAKWQDDVTHKKELALRLLSKEHLPYLSESEFGEVIKSLWASQAWRNKDYLVDSIIRKNGMNKLRTSLYDLLYGEKDLATRYESFRKSIRGLGVSYISEILFNLNPNLFGLWNRRAKEVLDWLGLGPLVPRVIAAGSDYVKACELLALVRDELQRQGIERPDFWTVDLFLWFIASEVIPKPKRKAKRAKPPHIPVEVYDRSYIPPILHDIQLLASEDPSIASKYEQRPEHVLEEKLWVLGRMLGFDVIELGHKVRERAPDGVYIARREGYAILFDAKARKEPYVIGTDDRTIIEYIKQYSNKLEREGVKKIYYLIVSGDFGSDNQLAMRRIAKETAVKGVCLIPASVLLLLLELKLKEPRITLAEIENFFFEAAGEILSPEGWKERVLKSLSIE